MEAMKTTLSEMMMMFNSRMSAFEAKLEESPTTPVSTTGLSAEFGLFRTFMVQAVSSLQQQLEILARSVDNIEMQGRRKILLLHGVPEASKEDTAAVVADVVKVRFNIKDFKITDIKRCHRMGRSSSQQKPRPILVKLQDASIRDTIWFSKTKLKGSGVTVSEFLTKARHDLFMAVREKFGVSKCWTRSGVVYVLGPDDARHRIMSLAEMNKVGQPEDVITAKPVTDTTKPLTAAVDITTVRPKRNAAAVKK